MMTPLVAESHQRSRRFHAEIARKAAAVRPRKPPLMVVEIPNTPFGVPKIQPPQPPVVRAIASVEFYYHQMWFHDLVSYRGDAAPERSAPTVSEIQVAVCRHFGVRVTDLISSRRTMDVVLPRQVAMYLSKRLTLRSLPEIGRRFGGRDHSTVHHSNAKIADMIARDLAFAAIVNELEARIRSQR